MVVLFTIFVYDILIQKKKTGKEFQYIVSRPKLGSDPPIGSDLESGCDTKTLQVQLSSHAAGLVPASKVEGIMAVSSTTQ